MTTTATPEDRRALAQEARRARAAHIIGLRRRVVATALATLVLATAVVACVTVPFVFVYEPLWTGIGIIAGWLLLVLGLSFYVRARIGVRRWRALHRFTALAWAMAIGHSLGSGTDADEWWFLAACGLVILPTLGLLASVLFGNSQVVHTPDRGPSPRIAP